MLAELSLIRRAVPHCASDPMSNSLPGPAESPVLPCRGETSNQPRVPAGVSFALYIFSVVLLWAVVESLPTELNGASVGHSPFPWLMFGQEILLLASALLPAWLLGKIEHRATGEYGLPLRELFGKSFWQGCLLGLAEISVLTGCIWAFGGYAFGRVALPKTALFEWLVFWSLFFVAVGLCEEFAFRGYAQFTLGQAIGFWPAACTLSLSFGALHLLNRSENWVGASSVAVTGLVFAFTLRRTGNLWFAVGWHAAFDFGETFLFSVPNSGLRFSGHLSNASLSGPLWLTGGAVGPEGSVFSFLLMGIAALLIHFLFPAATASRAQVKTTPGSSSQ